MNILDLPDFAKLRQKSRSAASGKGAELRIALLADTASQLLAASLAGMGAHLGLSLGLFEAEFDQIDLQVFTPQSDLYTFSPEFAIIWISAERLLSRFAKLDVAQRGEFAAEFARRAESLHERLHTAGIQVIFFNLADPGDNVFGSFGNKVRWSLTNQIRECNQLLAGLAQRHSGFHVYDFAALQSEVGRERLFQPSIYLTSKFAITPELLPRVARDLLRIPLALKGSGPKCVILDLDNTLWGGVIGDDGIERIQLGDLGIGYAFVAFQSWLKQLKDRGITLAVCSKNTESVAKEAFDKHPDMVLGLEDIAVFVANWDDKATNIRRIKEIVDVDYSAMAFFDDNPVERLLVRESFPTMLVPELPEDPAEYLPFLQRLNLFEAGSYTAQDADRTKSYQAEVQRRTEREQFVDPGDFLKSLAMKALVQPFNSYNIPRVAQLVQRSNQFNLRTQRYSEDQLAALGSSEQSVTFAFSLRDRFGDSGLISVVILNAQEDALFIDTWLMSCRVLLRGMEEFVLNTLVAAARSRGASALVGEYLPTAKNAMVKDHYQKLGFAPTADNRWRLQVADFVGRPVWIEAESTQ